MTTLARESFWQTWDEAHGSMTPIERLESDPETAIFDAAADHDYVVSERAGRGNRQDRPAEARMRATYPGE
jgi:hypothetical protein